MHNDPLLKLDGTEIPVINQFKFLGIIFDKKKLYFPFTIPKRKMQQSTKTPPCKIPDRIVHRPANHTKIHRTPIRRKIDNGSFYIRISQKIFPEISKHNPTWRTETCRCLQNISSEAPKPTQQLRFQKLCLQFYTKIKSLPTTPAHDCILNSKQPLFN